MSEEFWYDTLTEIQFKIGCDSLGVSILSITKNEGATSIHAETSSGISETKDADVDYWNRLVSLLDNENVIEWDEEYGDEADDGVEWILSLYLKGSEDIVIEGEDEFPDNWDSFLLGIHELLANVEITTLDEFLECGDELD
jgi:hypothetical protein